MGFRRRSGNPDQAQPELVSVAERLGASVAITTGVGDGFPDAVLGFRGQDLLSEFKTQGGIGKRGKRLKGGQLRESQKDFMRRWKGAPVRVVETGADMVRVLLEADAKRPDLRQVSGPDADLVACVMHLVDQGVTVADLQTSRWGDLLGERGKVKGDARK